MQTFEFVGIDKKEDKDSAALEESDVNICVKDAGELASVGSGLSTAQPAYAPPHMGFEVGDHITFYSQTHKRSIMGTVTFCHGPCNCYDIQLARSLQARQAIAPSRLELTVHPDEPVELLNGTNWIEGTYIRGLEMRRRFDIGQSVACYVEERRQWENGVVTHADNTNNLTVKITTQPEVEEEEIIIARGLCRIPGASKIARSISTCLTPRSLEPTKMFSPDEYARIAPSQEARSQARSQQNRLSSSPRTPDISPRGARSRSPYVTVACPSPDKAGSSTVPALSIDTRSSSSIAASNVYDDNASPTISDRATKITDKLRNRRQNPAQSYVRFDESVGERSVASDMHTIAENQASSSQPYAKFDESAESGNGSETSDAKPIEDDQVATPKGNV
eukprot:GEMP01043597.1.p1 GENE.GEMP01043597.1~~GEMP01043597.1.p1  ORF type:complete len:437 (+),score=93.39 GEMP01043597.1:138-1313(+)